MYWLLVGKVVASKWMLIVLDDVWLKSHLFCSVTGIYLRNFIWSSKSIYWFTLTHYFCYSVFKKKEKEKQTCTHNTVIYTFLFFVLLCHYNFYLFIFFFYCKLHSATLSQYKIASCTFCLTLDTTGL